MRAVTVIVLVVEVVRVTVIEDNGLEAADMHAAESYRPRTTTLCDASRFR
jgi:hypothetical protein